MMPGENIYCLTEAYFGQKRCIILMASELRAPAFIIMGLLYDSQTELNKRKLLLVIKLLSHYFDILMPCSQIYTHHCNNIKLQI